MDLPSYCYTNSEATTTPINSDCNGVINSNNLNGSCSVMAEEHPPATATPCSRTSLWDLYRSFVHRHHVSLELLDAGVSRILFWTPTTAGSASSGDGSVAERRHRQREVLYGILSLHRLAIDTALQQPASGGDDELQRQGLPHDFGATVRPNPIHEHHAKEDSNNQLSLSPTTIRIALTIIQSLLPSILELSQSSSSQNNSTNHENNNGLRRAARARLYVERLKFALRLYLLGSFWRTLWLQHQKKRQSLLQQGERPSSIPPLSIGLMADGGLFHGVNYSDIPTLAQEDALWKRQQYVGRRTGRRVVRKSPKGQLGTNYNSPPSTTATILSRLLSKFLPTTSINSNSHSINHLRVLLVMLGELLYAYRPLYWANTEDNTGSAAYRSWILSVAMDLISLQCCQLNHSTSVNRATQSELSRRKLRLLLYLLRAPVWDRWTEPATDRVERLLETVPVFGRLASTYMRDWLWYSKHPYVSEEG